MFLGGLFVRYILISCWRILVFNRDVIFLEGSFLDCVYGSDDRCLGGDCFYVLGKVNLV